MFIGLFIIIARVYARYNNVWSICSICIIFYLEKWYDILYTKESIKC